ncbi:MAG TPA: hypothetical protein VGZ69_05940 [Candidatus Rhabdochlamydia sp.]|jgi:hypothetical protein|nr:hypothetical protein [Candidatus Rhabdochlamydia sp.]
MISRLPEHFNCTNKFIPVSTDSTVLKIVKLSGLIFFGLLAFIVDYARKVLADRNITKEEGPDRSALVEKTLDNTRKIQDTPSTVEQTPIETEEDKHSEGLPAQEKALGVDLLSLVESKLGNTEKAQDRLSAIEETFTKIDDQKYILNFVAQKKTLETCLKDFKIDPKDFLIPIYKHLTKVAERLLKEYSNSELPNNYKEYTCILRDAISTKEYKNNKYLKIALIIQELCFAKFVRTVLTDLQEKTLENAIRFDPSRNMTSSNISKLIEVDNKILHNKPKGKRQSFLLLCEKIRNAAGINSDQLCSANIPELRSIHKVSQGAEPYDIYYIRYPTPTIETTKSFYARVTRDNATAVAPEFIGFLDSIQRKKIPFLHVNHQYMDKEDNDILRSADNNRAEAIQRLEETHAEVFHFLSLPFDGDVIDKINVEKDLTKWKQSLVSNVIGERQGFRIPKKFRKNATSKNKEMEQLLDNLHNLYFSGKSKLNKTERKVLLVIFYSYLKEYFKAKYEIRIMASVCKDNKDRGNVSACIDEALFNLRLGRENNEQALKDLYLRILSPFIFREEGIVGHRLKFLTDLLDHIAALDNDQKKKIRDFKVNEHYQIVDQWVPRSNEDMKI